jgi:sRNA-binding regulator protein Hfq
LIYKHAISTVSPAAPFVFGAVLENDAGEAK